MCNVARLHEWMQYRIISNGTGCTTVVNYDHTCDDVCMSSTDSSSGEGVGLDAIRIIVVGTRVKAEKEVTHFFRRAKLYDDMYEHLQGLYGIL